METGRVDNTFLLFVVLLSQVFIHSTVNNELTSKVTSLTPSVSEGKHGIYKTRILSQSRLPKSDLENESACVSSHIVLGVVYTLNSIQAQNGQWSVQHSSRHRFGKKIDMVINSRPENLELGGDSGIPTPTSPKPLLMCLWTSSFFHWKFHLQPSNSFTHSLTIYGLPGKHQ